jgi:3-hydroxyacyl-[acyl-carrier-protein] dehydratase
MQAEAEREQKILDVKEIVKVLPHRFPFLLVDKILEIDTEKGTILGQKNLTYNEAFFQGHFPGAPIMPGVLILEALAQTGAVLVHLKGEKEKLAVLLSVNNAKFRNPAKPGDILYLRGEGIHLSSKGGKIKAVATVNGKVAVEAEIGFALVDKSQI